MLLIERKIKLKNNRILSFAQYGNERGRPVVVFHGNPGSRLIFNTNETLLNDADIRLIVPDRPGYGGSEYYHIRCLMDYPDDIGQLLGSLGIERYACLGVSAGGPYALAVGSLFPERVEKITVVSGISPVNRDGAYEGMEKIWRFSFKISKVFPYFLLRLFIYFQTRQFLNNTEKGVDAYGDLLSDGDREILKRPEVRQWFVNTYKEAIAQGVKGWTKEAKILVSDWGFDLEHIKVNTNLWYFEDDTVVPVQMGEYLAERIPNAKLNIHPKGGHMAFIDNWMEIYENAVLK